MAFALAPLANRFLGNAGQTNTNFNAVNGIGNTVINNNVNNIDQSVTNNDNRTINNYFINLNEPQGGQACEAGKGKGKGKAKGKAKGCKGGRKGQGPCGPKSPQQMMMKMMAMMLKMMGQMQGGGGSCCGGGSPPGVNINIGGFRPPGFLG